MQSKLVRVISLLVILAVTFVTPPAPTQAQATTIDIDDGCPGADPPGFERRAPWDQDAWICISAQHPGQIYWAYNSDALYVSTAANPMEWVRWRPTITIAGRYLVEASIPSYFSNSPKTQQARYMVHHADGDTWVIVNQAATAGSWQNLGTYRFNAGTDGTVYLESYTGESTAHLVAADAVRFTFINQPPNVPNLASPANGSTTSNPVANLCLQDTGDPDNYPRNYRDYYYRIEATDGSWGQESGWTTNNCWGVTVPSAGAYRWRAQSGDGEVGSGWTGWWTFSYNAPPPAALTRSRLYLHGANYLALEFCGTNIHQDVYIGSRRAGRDFGVHAMRVDFGTTEQCATDSNLADGTVLPSTIYYSGVALNAQDVYSVCSSFGGLCDSIITPPATPLPSPPEPPPPLPVPGGSCPVPHYWQQDPRWASNKLGACTGPCGTIGRCGCALTSLAMTFKYYGANRDPGSLAACLGKSACPLVWSPACSEGKVAYNGWRAFDWSQLAAELQQGRPVILQLNRPGGMHFVVAVSGRGTDARNYLVNDPALKQGARVTLSAVLARRNYTPHSMRLYSGTRLFSETRRFLTYPFASDPDMTVQKGWHNPGIDYIKGVRDNKSTWVNFDVLAPADGEACKFPNDEGQWNTDGWYVRIAHTQSGINYTTEYNHLDSAESFIPRCNSTTHVTRGQKIGVAGDSNLANCQPPCIHLHFELRVNSTIPNPAGTKVDPYDIWDVNAASYPDPNTGMPATFGPNRYWITGADYCYASTVAGESEPIPPGSALTGPSTGSEQTDGVTAFSSTQSVTGTVVLYRNTETTMTLELAAQSLAGNATEMLIWTNSITNTTWQPFTYYVGLPLSEEFFVQFRDDVGNISAPISGTTDPVASPLQWYPVFMPIISRDYAGSR